MNHSWELGPGGLVPFRAVDIFPGLPSESLTAEGKSLNFRMPQSYALRHP